MTSDEDLPPEPHGPRDSQWLMVRNVLVAKMKSARQVN